MEDSAAVVGVFLAAGCLGLTHILNSPVYDAIGSVCIGSQSLDTVVSCSDDTGEEG